MSLLSLRWIAPGLLLILLAGCGRESSPPPSVSQVATTAKERLDGFVEAALKNPKQAGDQLTILLESLDAYAKEYGGGFVELRDMAKAMVPEVKNAKNKLELEGMLGKLQNKMNEIAASPGK